MRVRQAQRTVSVSHLSAGRPRSSTANRLAIIGSNSDGASGSVDGSMVSSRTSSFSPRNIARIRCEGSFVYGSSKSK
jgi:hypothetical protein